MSAGAIVLAASGAALLFAPGEVQRVMSATDAALPIPPAVLQLWGASLLGLAATSWVGRGLTLGGIYGRALVMGNLVHWMVGGFVTLRAALNQPSLGGLWAATALFGAFAAAFAWLLRRPPGVTPPPTS